MEIITSELNGRTWPEPEFSISKKMYPHFGSILIMQIIYVFLENAANIGVEDFKKWSTYRNRYKNGMVRNQ